MNNIRASLGLLWSVVLVVPMTACGGEAITTGGGTAGATGGVGGANGGSGGSVGGSGGAVGGSDGSVGGSGGSGGSVGGSGGSVGGSGGAPLPPSCTKDSDCKLFSDCCTCEAYGPHDPEPASCPQECLVDTCRALGLANDHLPKCIAGKCIVAFDCDPSHAMCDSVPPACPKGKVLTVKGGCWGGCVDPQQCDNVPSCDACQGADNELCVENVAETTTRHCVANEWSCEITCDCLGSLVCTDSTFHQCEDGTSKQDNVLMCTCPEC